ncbi:MAG: hypothetical protein HN778_14055 [Prolixibacteraceae bacterium]|jgi:hypothetical protein|nr:hypothetical protein [Prolixibacteraceae bacterium]MBT6005699.1 hypothetical protein [Prolixibacteraceae bacterium]MBT6998588.1 hypothetical protein [Prolixibacteraceae bacterium]MBT7395951.1 hypothetical protein [Prolixibacteraceae bacterium]
MKKLIIIIPILLFVLKGNSQLNNWSFNGYIKDLGMYYKPKVPIPGIESNYLATNIIHNRLNFKWFASNELTFAVEARNRIFFGQMIREFPEYDQIVDIDNGYFDLSETVFTGNGWFMHSIIDRAYFDYSKGNWQVRVGRQRINWGINLVWNPNDIFNSFSYFDFDYEERPGTDAVKIQYYTSVTSSAELVYKIGRNEDETAIAGKYQFSKFNYDFQFLGGWVGKDYVIGGGWAGDIKGGGFRGEASYFIPREKNNGSVEAFVASVSGDYTLKNSLYLHGGVLFNSHGAKGKAGGRSFFDQNLSAKMLSLAMYNLFGQFSFPITPIFSANFSGMLNPSDGSSFIGPACTYSLGNNLELMVSGQLFFGDNETEYGDYGKAIFGRIKWAF